MYTTESAKYIQHFSFSEPVCDLEYHSYIRAYAHTRTHTHTHTHITQLFARKCFSLLCFQSPYVIQKIGLTSLDDLLIEPVQRIPRYVLLIDAILKHTPPSHTDYAGMWKAHGFSRARVTCVCVYMYDYRVAVSKPLAHVSAYVVSKKTFLLNTWFLV